MIARPKSANRMIKNLIHLFFCTLLCFPFLAVSAEKKGKLVLIDNVRMTRNSMIIRHNAYGDIGFRKRVYDGPPRLVVDILNADLVGKKRGFAIQDSEVSEIRIGQFEPTVVRIVMQAKSVSSLEKVKIDNAGQDIYFKFGVDDVQVTDIDFEKGDVLIKATNVINYRNILLEDPERLVVDLIGAKLKSSNLKKTFKNGDEEIRSAQFDKSTVRLVFSGKKSHKRDIELVDHGKALLIKGKDRRGRLRDKRNLKDKVESMQLIERNKQESIFIIKASKDIDFKHLKLHRPERLVLDLFNLGYEDTLIATQFPETEHVKDVRFGVASLGTPVTRVVFDLKTKGLDYDFSQSSDGKEIRVRIKGAVPEDPDLPLAQKSVGKKVVIDPGHGGYDPGAVYGGYNEKDITLLISQKLKKYLEKAGIKAYMTRSDDRFISLAERVEISNSIRPAMFVSVHVNALATNPKMDGLQTYYYSSNGLKIAQVTHNQLLQDVGMVNRNIRRARFWVTKYTAAPSILAELGFMTNSTERKKLASSSYQDKLAKSLAKGIIKYLEK